MDSISILIPTHNRVDQLKPTLASIAKQEVEHPAEVEVIVVANGCTDKTIDYANSLVEEFPFELRVYDEQQLGLPSARNRAVAEARNEILAFLDDDVILSEGYLQAIFDVYRDFPADMVGGKTELLWEAVQKPEWFPDQILNLLSCKDHGDKVIELHSRADAIGCNFSYRRKVAETIGGFKLGLGRTGKLLLGGEEAEFLDRALNKNYRLFYAPDCHLQHWVAPNRVTLEYLGGVADGNAMSIIFARPTISAWWIVKATIYHTACYLRHLISEFYFWLLGNKRQKIFHFVRRKAQGGYLGGIWLRLTGRSTLKSKG